MIAMDEKVSLHQNGSDTYEWKIEFEDDSQYEAACDFLGWASPRMDKLLFAAHDNFWMDYLNGDLDVDAFKDFLEGTNNGIPNYGIGDEENMYIDETKLQWTKYMNLWVPTLVPRKNYFRFRNYRLNTIKQALFSVKTGISKEK